MPMTLILRLIPLFLWAALPLFAKDADSLAESNRLIDFEGTPSSAVAGCVNVISGDFFDQQVDLVGAGQEPLVFVRSYSSASGERGGVGCGWHHNHEGVLSMLDCGPVKNFGIFRAWLSGRLGTKIQYEAKYQKEKEVTLPITEELLNRGITNTSQGRLSGQTNLKNSTIRVLLEQPAEVALTDGEGTQTLYRQIGDTHVSCCGVVLLRHYLLSWVRMANKMEQHYHYGQNNLASVLLTQPSGTIINQLHFICPSNQDFRNTLYMQVKSDNGLMVQYNYGEDYFNGRKNKLLLTHVMRPSAPDEWYDYEKYHFKGYYSSRISEKRRPDGRRQKIRYYHPGQHYVVGNEKIKIKFNNPSFGRVASLQSPLGVGGSLETTHTFRYHIENNQMGNGRTDVFDAHGIQRSYHFNKFKLSHITCKDANATYSSEKFYWGAAKSPDDTNLIARTYGSANEAPLLCYYYTYDENGNVIDQLLCGNLTGASTVPLDIEDQGFPKNNGCDRHIVQFSYSGAPYNLKTEERDARKRVTYQYVDNSNWVSREFIWSEGTICQRTFYEYDSNGFLRRKIVDDGSTQELNDLTGVSERRITLQQPTTTTPYGLVAEEEQRYWDFEAEEERLLSRVVNHYSKVGHLCSQEHYDSHNVSLYTLFWEYDIHGNVLREVNAIGEEIVRCYDANDNMIEERGPQPGFVKRWSYDYCNRLTSKQVMLPSGESFTTQYRYNLLSQLIEEMDRYGNVTSHQYDHLGRRIRTNHPTAGDQEPIFETQEYDCLGNVTQKIDANGQQTDMACTIRGAPYHIVHPNGAVESTRYTLDGLPEEHTAADGTTTRTCYDYQKRPTEVAIYDPEGNRVSLVTRHYNAFHLLREVDNGGHISDYRYDGAGRLSSIIRGDRTIHYRYDSRGNIAMTTQRISDSDAIVTHKQYDLLERLICERVTDGTQQLQSVVEYRYDSNGNRTHVIRYSDSGSNTVESHYDPLNRLVEEVDGEGNRTHISYLTHCCASAHYVAAVETTDPMGMTTLVIQDAMGRDSEVIRKNPFGVTIQSHTQLYDGNGNRICRIDQVIDEEGQVCSQQRTSWQYDSRNALIKVTRAEGEPEQQQTRYRYDLMGRKTHTTYADGHTLHASYDTLGRLEELHSSDGTIHYYYCYDALNNPILVKDRVSANVTQRRYDRHSQLIAETLATGYVITYRRDGIGRISEVLYPNGSSARYHYRGEQLVKVAKHNSAGVEAYSHHYLTYDLSGRLTSDRAIGSTGTMHYSYDGNGQVRTIAGDFWSEDLHEISPVGNLLSRTFCDKRGEKTDHYRYDLLSQLIEEGGSHSHTYHHDSIYNRTCRDGSPITLNGLNQITASASARYRYDARGHLAESITAEESVSYSYDALGRLTTVTTANATFYYSYDPFNRRLIKKRYCGSALVDSESYLYQEQNEIAQYNRSRQQTAFRLLGSGQGAEIGAAVAIEVGSTVYTPIHDHNGNLVTLIHTARNRVAQVMRYSAYGEETLFNSSGTPQPAEKALSPWRLSSKRYDPETGWTFFGRRHYSPTLGRWVTPDPAGDYDGPNLYAYLHNNPLTHFDLYGLFDENGSTQSWWAWGWNSFTKACSYSGAAIEAYAHHTMPQWRNYPSSNPLRAGVKGCGRLLQGKSFCDPEDSIGFYSTTVGSRETGPVANITATGILTSRDGIRAFGQEMSSRMNDAKVHATGVPSKGLLSDLLRCGIQKLGSTSHYIRDKAQHIQNVYDQTMKQYGQALLCLTEHSGGCLDGVQAYNLLSPEVRSNSIINTIGGAYMRSSDQGYREAYDYINNADIVPMTNIGPVLLNRGGNVIRTGYKSSGCLSPIRDHLISSPGYQKVLKRISEENLALEEEYR